MWGSLGRGLAGVEGGPRPAADAQGKEERKPPARPPGRSSEVEQDSIQGIFL